MTAPRTNDATARTATTVRVRVPCSTSNVGGGFDCIGIALERWLEVDATLRSGAGAAVIERAGALAALDAAGVTAADDLVMRGVALACGAAGRPVPAGLAIRARSDIPVARGLGSSAAALVAGALLADGLLGLGLGARRVAAITATEEGHPDNVAPMLFGGAVLGVPAAVGGWTFSPLAIHQDIGIVVAIPEFETSTRAMRAALPPTLAFGDAVRAAGKGAALVRGLATADAALLTWALDDVLHVPHRRALVPGYDAVERAGITAGAWGVTLSGAGSAMLALGPHERLEAIGDAMAGAWRAMDLHAESWIARLAAGATASRPA